MTSLKTSILKSLYFHKAQSIAEISDGTGKSVPLVTKVIKELLDDDQIESEGPRASTGGRRAMVFSLNKNKHGAIIAIAIDQYFTSISVYDTNNTEIHPIETISAPLYLANESYELIENLISKIIDKLKKTEILAVGITIPGFLDSDTGINNSYLPSIKFHNLKERIQQKFNIRTYIENDSSAIAIAEMHFGLGYQSPNALVVNLNWGVGLGMILNEKLFRGHTGYAGEFSHIPLANHDMLCSCGKKGCLEVEASLHYALGYIKQLIENGERSSLEEVYHKNHDILFGDLVKAYHTGDQLAIKAIKKMTYMLGKGISTLIHILNPEIIIVSGRGAVFGNLLLNELQSSIQEFCIPRLSQKTIIKISELKNVQLIASVCIAIKQIEKFSKPY